MNRFILITLAMLGHPLCGAMADEPDLQAERGEELANSMCAECHATGRTGHSAHAGAPLFRTLEHRLDLDAFMGRLREGLMSGHPDMPTFRFTRDDARALIAYLRSLQSP